MRRLGLVTASGFGVLFVLWALDVAGAGLPRAVDRGALLLALAAGALYLGGLARRLWRGEVLDVPSGRLLLLLVAAALVVFLAGLGHEIGGLDFADEGTFLAQAGRINAGRPFRAWFVYPHFLFYWDAFALWIAGLGGRLVPAAAAAVWGVEGELNVAALVTRVASSTLAALAVVPVFLAGRKVAGPAAGTWAGAAAGALLLASPTFVAVGRTNLADVPGACFAACALWGCASLLAGESARGYLGAGLAAGLAAGSKYPAGLVAIAVAGPWLRGALARRRPAPGVLWAGLAALSALAAFVLTTPSLLRFPGAALGGEGADLLFGARLYSRAGWQGIVRESNLLYYLQQVGHAFGWPALVLALAGFGALDREARRRALWLLPFPVVFVALLLALRVALRRNLMPVLPFLAVLAGVGLAGCRAALDRRLPRRFRRPATAALAVAALALPALATAAQLARTARPTTREEAAAWVRAHLPPGSFLVQEQYTPVVGPPERFPARTPRFAARLPIEELRDPRHDFVFLSSQAWNRFLAPTNLADLANDQIARRYREIFATFPLVREWTPGRLQDGPVLRLYRTDPEPLVHATAATFQAGDALVADPTMRPEGSPEIAFAAAGQWALFKAYLAAGAYQARLDAEIGAPVGRGAGDARLRVRDRGDEEIAGAALARAGGAADAPAAGSTGPSPILEGRFDLPRPDKFFLYVELPAGSRLRGLAVGSAVP